MMMLFFLKKECTHKPGMQLYWTRSFPSPHCLADGSSFSNWSVQLLKPLHLHIITIGDRCYIQSVSPLRVKWMTNAAVDRHCPPAHLPLYHSSCFNSPTIDWGLDREAASVDRFNVFRRDVKQSRDVDGHQEPASLRIAPVEEGLVNHEHFLRAANQL